MGLLSTLLRARILSRPLTLRRRRSKFVCAPDSDSAAATQRPPPRRRSGRASAAGHGLRRAAVPPDPGPGAMFRLPLAMQASAGALSSAGPLGLWAAQPSGNAVLRSRAAILNDAILLWRRGRCVALVGGVSDGGAGCILGVAGIVGRLRIACRRELCRISPDCAVSYSCGSNLIL